MANVIKFKGNLIDVDYPLKEVTIRLPDGLPLTLEWPQGTKRDFMFAKFQINEIVEVSFDFGTGITRIG